MKLYYYFIEVVMKAITLFIYFLPKHLIWDLHLSGILCIFTGFQSPSEGPHSPIEWVKSLN